MSGLLGTSEEATEAAASMSFLVLLPFLARDRISTPLSLLSLSLSLSIYLSVCLVEYLSSAPGNF